MPELKPFYYWTYNPLNAIFGKKSDHASYTILYCQDCNACQCYKEGCCVLHALWNTCPFGKKVRTEGPTPRAQKFYTFLGEPEKKYPSLDNWKTRKLDSPKKITVIGPNNDYIYLPLDYLDNYNNPIAEDIGLIHKHLLPTNNFTPELVVRLMNYVPRALMGGPISDYQKSLPMFAFDVRKKFPNIWKKACELDPELEKYNVKIDFKGQKAYLKTLLPGQVKYNAKSWDWDGKVLSAKAKDVMTWSSECDEEEIVTITPSENSIVEIIDNDTVDEDKVRLVTSRK